MSNDTIRSHWLLAPACASDASLPVPLGDVTALLEQVGRSSGSSDEVAGQLLHLLGRHVPLAQCTIFSFQGDLGRASWGSGTGHAQAHCL
ncbi:hypothetical protein ACHFCA_13560 [Delftia tsuruhatensis]